MHEIEKNSTEDKSISEGKLDLITAVAGITFWVLLGLLFRLGYDTAAYGIILLLVFGAFIVSADVD